MHVLHFVVFACLYTNNILCTMAKSCKYNHGNISQKTFNTPQCPKNTKNTINNINFIIIAKLVGMARIRKGPRSSQQE